MKFLNKILKSKSQLEPIIFKSFQKFNEINIDKLNNDYIKFFNEFVKLWKTVNIHLLRIESKTMCENNNDIIKIYKYAIRKAKKRDMCRGDREEMINDIKKLYLSYSKILRELIINYNITINDIMKEKGEIHII